MHADQAYDIVRGRAYLRRRGITCRIARRGVETSKRLGRHRWVVERTPAWMSRYRQHTVRYDKRADIHLALLRLACLLICWRALMKPPALPIG